MAFEFDNAQDLGRVFRSRGIRYLFFAFAGDAFRVIYALQLPIDIWVVHAFQKKSRQGAKTPQREIGPIRYRLN